MGVELTPGNIVCLYLKRSELLSLWSGSRANLSIDTFSEHTTGLLVKVCNTPNHTKTSSQNAVVPIDVVQADGDKLLVSLRRVGGPGVIVPAEALIDEDITEGEILVVKHYHDNHLLPLHDIPGCILRLGHLRQHVRLGKPLPPKQPNTCTVSGSGQTLDTPFAHQTLQLADIQQSNGVQGQDSLKGVQGQGTSTGAEGQGSLQPGQRRSRSMPRDAAVMEPAPHNAKTVSSSRPSRPGQARSSPPAGPLHDEPAPLADKVHAAAGAGQHHAVAPAPEPAPPPAPVHSLQDIGVVSRISGVLFMLQPHNLEASILNKVREFGPALVSSAILATMGIMCSAGGVVQDEQGVVVDTSRLSDGDQVRFDILQRSLTQLQQQQPQQAPGWQAGPQGVPGAAGSSAMTSLYAAPQLTTTHSGEAARDPRLGLGLGLPPLPPSGGSGALTAPAVMPLSHQQGHLASAQQPALQEQLSWRTQSAHHGQRGSQHGYSPPRSSMRLPRVLPTAGLVPCRCALTKCQDAGVKNQVKQLLLTIKYPPETHTPSVETVDTCWHVYEADLRRLTARVMPVQRPFPADEVSFHFLPPRLSMDHKFEYEQAMSAYIKWLEHFDIAVPEVAVVCAMSCEAASESKMTTLVNYLMGGNMVGMAQTVVADSVGRHVEVKVLLLTYDLLLRWPGMDCIWKQLPAHAQHVLEQRRAVLAMLRRRLIVAAPHE